MLKINIKNFILTLFDLVFHYVLLQEKENQNLMYKWMYLFPVLIIIIFILKIGLLLLSTFIMMFSILRLNNILNYTVFQDVLKLNIFIIEFCF